jgi:hypothetical protein
LVWFGHNTATMPFVRNPFKKQDENVRPTAALNGIEQSVNGSKPIETKEKEPVEYKLSGNAARSPSSTLPN